jgi:bacillithiol system protein YtxJ
MDWIPLVREEQLKEISAMSFSKPVALFKHSTRCGISAMAKNRLETKWDIDSTELPIYYLDLLQYRDISNTIASSFGIQHESPQLLLIRNGKCIYDASHSGVSVDGVKQALQSISK